MIVYQILMDLCWADSGNAEKGRKERGGLWITPVLSIKKPAEAGFFANCSA
jgi:hypothetical protein